MTGQSLIQVNWIPLNCNQMHSVLCNANDADCVYFGNSDSVALASIRLRWISCIILQEAFSRRLDSVDWLE